MLAGGLRPDLAGIVMPQTPRTMQQLRSVAEKTLTVANNRPLAQLSARSESIENGGQNDGRPLKQTQHGRSNGVFFQEQTMSSSRTTRPPTNSRINTQYQR